MIAVQIVSQVGREAEVEASVLRRDHMGIWEAQLSKGYKTQQQHIFMGNMII